MNVRTLRLVTIVTVLGIANWIFGFVVMRPQRLLAAGCAQNCSDKSRPSGDWTYLNGDAGWLCFLDSPRTHARDLYTDVDLADGSGVQSIAMTRMTGTCDTCNKGCNLTLDFYNQQSGNHNSCDNPRGPYSLDKCIGDVNP